jgi:hypothetical protein
MLITMLLRCQYDNQDTLETMTSRVQIVVKRTGIKLVAPQVWGEYKPEPMTATTCSLVALRLVALPVISKAKVLKNRKSLLRQPWKLVLNRFQGTRAPRSLFPTRLRVLKQVDV